jgi:MoaA/NifB/PqqE/SkfB family radical SAM enzyme
MRPRSLVQNALEPLYKRNHRLKAALRMVDWRVDSARNRIAQVLPNTIRPEPRSLFITLTANCNLRCKGCRYGRDFMPGHQLSWPIVRALLEDAKTLGFHSVRLYGGEPLLHKELTRIVEYASKLNLRFWLTTNGILLKEKIDDLFSAGLRDITIGFYGIGKGYDDYVQKKDRFVRLEAGVDYLRSRYGYQVSVALGWVLMRPTCNVDSVMNTWHFAQKYHTPIYVNLIHYSLPYFTEGEDRHLQFTAADRSDIEEVVSLLVSLKSERPELIDQHEIVLRSIPDWLIKGPNMRVPCDAKRLIWVGPDGTVQLCYVTFKLGNLHSARLKEILFTEEHNRAARDAFLLNCPNCHCGYGKRTMSHSATRNLYV